MIIIGKSESKAGKVLKWNLSTTSVEREHLYFFFSLQGSPDACIMCVDTDFCIFCCGKYYPKLKWLNTAHLLHLTVTVNQEIWPWPCWALSQGLSRLRAEPTWDTSTSKLSWLLAGVRSWGCWLRASVLCWLFAMQRPPPPPWQWRLTLWKPARGRVCSKAEVTR